MNQAARDTAKRLVKTYFKNDSGEPFELSNGQTDIFLSIFLKRNPRTQIIAPTQYGKSETISMALLLRTIIYKDKFAVVSGNKNKAMIIMEKVIQHSFDHPMFYKQLELDQNMKLDRLRRERSKEHITWMKGGSIKIFSAQSKNRSAVKESLTGFGSANIVQDESALVADDIQAMVMRMLGGHKDSFLLKIGNPFYRNHFLRTWNGSRYYKIFIDYHQALKEGRFTQDFIEEMRDEPFFDVLYECKFPDSEETQTGGYRQLFPDNMIHDAFISEDEIDELIGEDDQIRLGADFAGGGNDKSAYVLRWPKVMKLESTNRNADTMTQVPIIEHLQEDYEIEPEDTALDYGGLGQGIGDRLHEKEIYTNNIFFGQSAPEEHKAKFANMRAYIYFEMFKWIRDGGKILRNDGFLELYSINYKEDSERKFLIQPKKDLKKRMKELNLKGTSPDIADAAALTFADNSDLITDDDFDVL